MDYKTFPRIRKKNKHVCGLAKLSWVYASISYVREVSYFREANNSLFRMNAGYNSYQQYEYEIF